MNGPSRSSAQLDERRRKVLFRSWHRGMREVDLILGGFADAQIGDLDDAELTMFEALMDEPDAEILKWVTGAEQVPVRHDTPVFRRILATPSFSAL